MDRGKKGRLEGRQEKNPFLSKGTGAPKPRHSFREALDDSENFRRLRKGKKSTTKKGEIYPKQEGGVMRRGRRSGEKVD